jgi:hypothetical protein
MLSSDGTYSVCSELYRHRRPTRPGFQINTASRLVVFTSLFERNSSSIPFVIACAKRQNRSVSSKYCSFTSLALNYEFTSDEAIFLHRVDRKEVFVTFIKPLHYKVRAGRLLRGFNNNKLSRSSIFRKPRLAMTKGSADGTSLAIC